MIVDLPGCSTAVCSGGNLLDPTPVKIHNRPGLAAIAYRCGTYAHFKAALLARLSDPDLNRLQGLSGRDDDDFTIALLDAWAMVADVLTFYQERIANESYLRTATEKLSLTQLAWMTGYEPGPGVAASAYLAFTIDQTAGSPPAITIEPGTRVQSTPGPNELPQIYETVERIEARAAWNELRPRSKETQPPGSGATQIYLKGTATNLRPGDTLLLVAEGPDNRPELIKKGNWSLHKIRDMTVNHDGDYTLLGLDLPLPVSYVNPKVYALRQRAALFGHNAPDWQVMPEQLKKAYLKLSDSAKLPIHHEWPDLNLMSLNGGEGNNIYLDAIYPQILPSSWLVLSSPDCQELYRITQAADDARARFTLSARTTRVTLHRPPTRFNKRIRDTVAMAQSERLETALAPISSPVSGDRVILDRQTDGLKQGQALVISGLTTSGQTSEVVRLYRADPAGEGTRLIFTTPLVNSYQRESVTINANLVPATHGETVREILGSGSGARPNQSFNLRQPPLTYVSSTSPRGAASTLEVRVNGLLWQEVPSLYGHGPDERIYVTRTDDQGQTTVKFGDGRTGARLPTGQQNVVATYRKGTGLEGLVKANQLNLLLTRPLGVKEVCNPLAARGAAAPEPAGELRRNIPLQVLTLGRIVSLQDYEDFAQAFPGIAKALATWTWFGGRRGIFVTVAGPGGAPADQINGLAAAMHKAGDPFVALRVVPYRPALFGLKVDLKEHPDYLASQVAENVRMALAAKFSFVARDFGQPVFLGEVMAAIQSVPGVLAVNVRKLLRSDSQGGSGLKSPLIADAPRGEAGGTYLGAELLLLDDDNLELGVMA